MDLRPRQRIRIGLFFSFVATGISCGDSAISPPGEAADRLGIGTADAAIALDRDGCFGADVLVASSTGVTLRLPAGCLGFRDERTADRFALSVAPAPIAIRAPGQLGVQSAYRITIEDAAGAPVRASFDPPLEIEASLPPQLGSWTVQGYVAGREWSQEVEGAEPVKLDAVAVTSAETARLLVRQTGVASVLFEPPPGAPSALASASAVALGGGTPPIFTQTLPLAGPLDRPLCSWRLVNGLTGVIHAMNYDFSGIPLGVPQTAVRDGRVFSVRTIDAGGAPSLVLESVARNRFFATVIQCDTAADGSELGEDTEDFMSGGCSEALCPDDIYVGLMKAAITIPVNDGLLWQQYFEELEDELDLPERAVLRSFTGSDDGLIGRFDILGSEASVPAIRERLPEDWGGADDDRLMSLLPPPPIEVVLSLSGEGDGMGNVESDLEPILSCDVPPLTCTASYLTIEGGEIGLRANPDEESVFAGWTGCPDPLLDECQLSWDDDDVAVSFDVTARFESIDENACNAAYAGVAGYLPCEGAPVNQCKFYTRLDDVRSCDDACAQGGGVCVQALRDVADGCSGSIPRPCDDPANDRICFCTLP